MNCHGCELSFLVELNDSAITMNDGAKAASILIGFLVADKDKIECLLIREALTLPFVQVAPVYLYPALGRNLTRKINCLP